MRHMALQQQRELTEAQLREQIREQVRKSIQDAQRAAQEARAEARSQVVVTPPAPPAAPLPPAEAIAIGQADGQVIVHPGRGPFERADDIPMRAQELGMMFILVAGLVIIGLPIARAVGRLIDRKWAAPALPATELAPQLQRIEQAVEAMAIEIERISESQRYMARLHAAREPEPAAPREASKES